MSDPEILIYHPGDPDAGLPDSTVRISGLWTPSDLREETREALTAFFGEMFDGRVSVRWDDEVDGPDVY